jgi:hypothetical protein
MMRLKRTATTALIVGALLGALLGCQKKEGPMEQAGKVVDQTVDKVGQRVEKAGDSIQEAAKGENKK